jgi:glycosyltransferase involved in cell wall biosynthesis
MDNPFENKRILIVLHTMVIGGSQTQVLHFADYLKNRLKAEVQVWSFIYSEYYAQMLTQHGIPFFIPSPFFEGGKIQKTIGLLRFLLKIRSFRPHIIMPFNNLPNKVCGAVWKWTGAKTCIWNQRDEGRDITGGFIEKLALKYTPIFVSNSEEGKKFLQKTFNIESEVITIIYNGVRLARPKLPKEEWKKKLNIDSSSLAAVMVANLTQYKDHQTLLKAWKSVIQSASLQRKPVLVVAGKKCETYKPLKDYVHVNQLEPYVRFPGFVDDVPGLLKACDLGIFSSKFEGCPNGILESMAAGLPVVATDITGAREALGEDYPFLVPKDNSEVFAQKIIAFLSDPKMRQTYGAQNFKRVSELFSLERMTLCYQQLLSRIIRHP